MPELNLRERSFSTTRLGDSVALVVPDAWRTTKQVQRLAAASGAQVVPHSGFSTDLFASNHVIACGNLANNAAVRRLYTARRCFVDTFFPGAGCFLTKSISDPLGTGRNAVVVGASEDDGLRDGLDALITVIEASDGTLGRVHAQRLRKVPEPPPSAELDALVAQDLATWDGGWVASPFRGGKLRSYLWNFYRSDAEAWSRLIVPIFTGSLPLWRAQRQKAPDEYHDFFWLQQYIHLWDLIEDSLLFDTDDRHGVVRMFVELLRHLAGLFYLREDVNPDGVARQNHVTFIALNLAVGHDYLSSRYGIDEFAGASERAARIFAGQASGYKPNDDAGVGYVWHVPHHTLEYMLGRDDARFLAEGHVADLCRLAAVTTDNLRSEVGYGDSSGFAAFEGRGWQAHLWPLMASVWHSRDAEHLWLLNWLGQGKRPSPDQALEGLYAAVECVDDRFVVDGVEPEEPTALLGMTALPLAEPCRRWLDYHIPEAYRPVPGARYFDKLSLRPGFDGADEYLLLDGVGTFCHGHEDTNAILRLTWGGRAWLADGDYIRAAPKFHNSITVLRDGVGVLTTPGDGVVMPPLARLEAEVETHGWGLVQSVVRGYNGLDWRRNLIWRPGRYIVVLDELHCQVPGEFRCRCLWRLVGDVDTTTGGDLRLQQGDVSLRLINADASVSELVADSAGPWGGYPHHDGAVQVLHQKQAAALQSGDTMRFVNVFTPHAEVRIERLGPGLLRVTDGDDTALLGVGAQSLGGVEVEGPVFVVARTPDGPQAIGARTLDRHAVDGDTTLLDPESDAGRAIAAVMATAAEPKPAVPATPVAESIAEPRLRVRWQRPATGAAISAVAVDDDGVLVACEDGILARLSLEDGAEVWRVELDSHATALCLADIDGDGGTEALVGTQASQLMVLDGGTGQERWRQPLKNLNEAPGPATAICVSALAGDGELSVLVGTAGWFVNTFAIDGTPRWARWIRYHVITHLAATDVDGDGRAEVIVGNTYSTPLSVHEHDGSFRWSTLEQVGAEGNATTPRRGVHMMQMLLCDVDDDGRKEIVYGTEDGWVYAVESVAGDEVWRLNVVGAVVGLTRIADGIVVASEFGDLYVLDLAGQVRTHCHVSEWIRALAGGGDEAVVATEGGRLWRLDAGGAIRTGFDLGREVRRLHRGGDGVLGVLADGGLCYVAPA